MSNPKPKMCNKIFLIIQRKSRQSLTHIRPLLLFYTISLLAVPRFANAEEVNEFIKPNELHAPSNAALNQLINQSMQAFAASFNAQSFKKCDRNTLTEGLLYHFDRNFTEIGGLLYKNSVKKNDFAVRFIGSTNQEKSPYKNKLIYSCCVRSVNISNTPVGIDKIDHFFGSGGMLWGALIQNPKLTDSELMAQNVNQEAGVWGLNGLGVKSYGDLNANWSGLEFFRNLIDGKNPYYKCQDGKVSLQREFKIEDYFSKAWSESVNCSAFTESKIAAQFKANLQAMGFTCPMSQEDCNSIIAHYADKPDLQKNLISPVCLNKIPLEKSVETTSNWKVSDVASALWGGAAEGISLDKIKGFFNPPEDFVDPTDDSGAAEAK